MFTDFYYTVHSRLSISPFINVKSLFYFYPNEGLHPLTCVFRQEIFLTPIGSSVLSVTLGAPLLQVITLVMCMTLRNRHGSLTMTWRSLKSKRLPCRVIEIAAAIFSSICTRKSLMSCWRQKKPLRHLAWRWGELLVRPREENLVGGGMSCTSVTATLLTVLCPKRIGTLLDAGATAAQGQTKRSFSHVHRSMLFYGNLGLIYSWLSSFSPTRVPLPFVLGMNTCCKYICTYPHTYIEWMEP